MPLDHLFVIVLVVTAPSIREDEATERVPSEIGTMRIHLTSPIVGLEVYLCLINKTDDLDVVRGPHELNTLKSTSGDEASSMTWLGTPCDGLVLCLSDSGRAIGWTPDTEI